MPNGTESPRLWLSPSRRGAPHDIRTALAWSLEDAASLRIASQQVADRALVEQILASKAARKTRVLVEQDYLFERSPLPAEEAWSQGGRFENNRQCLMALLRSNIELRTDFSRSARQHINFISAQTQYGGQRILISSANFAPGSLGKHLNWSLTSTSEGLADTLEKVFDQVWEGGLDGISHDVKVLENAGTTLRLVVGTQGETIDAITKTFESATSSIRFAFFNISSSAEDVLHPLKTAAGRGVSVAGVVDGDQSHQAWDAIPDLQTGGAEAAYYPGLMTGASGRMHHKVAVIDNAVSYLGTANISASARRSLELGLFVHSPRLAERITQEIERLQRQSSLRPLRILNH